MKHRRLHARLFLFLIVCAFSGTSIAANTVDGTLGHWLAKRAAPELSDVLTRHPRFKGELLHFQAASDNLTHRIERRLSEHLLRRQGIRLAWREATNCTLREASSYRIRIDIRPEGSLHTVNVRILDLEEGQWVGGVSLSWRGRLNRSERKDLEQPFQLAGNARHFSLETPDRLSRHLVEQVTCRLPYPPMEQVFVRSEHALLRKYLTEHLENRSWRIADSSGEEGEVLEVRIAEEPDYQRVTLHLQSARASRSQLLASALVLSSAPRLMVAEPLLGPINADIARKQGICRGPVPCAEVSFDVEQSAYLVMFSTSSGRVNLLDCDAPDRPTTGNRRFRLKVRSSDERDRPSVGFYVLASTDKATARRLASTVGQAPGACDGNITRADWMKTLGEQMSRAGNSAAWEAIHLSWEGDGIVQL